MSKRSSRVIDRGTGPRRSRKSPLVATAAAIGGAGIVLTAPAAALLADPPEAQAQIDLSSLTSIFGLAGLSANGGLAGGVVGTATSITDPFFSLATAIPFFNVFVSNGADGTAANPNGGNAGILAGNGGKGYTSTVAVDGRPHLGQPAVTAATPGSSSAAAATAATAVPVTHLLGLAGGSGGNGGAGAAFGIGNGGNGGGGGGGGGGLNGFNPTATSTAGIPGWTA